MQEYSRRGHTALLPFPAAVFSFCFCSTRGFVSLVWGFSKECSEFKFSRMSSILVRTLWRGWALGSEENWDITQESEEAVRANTAPTCRCWTLIPVLFFWNCRYWCQNRVHPIDHLFGRHQTKDGCVFSPTPRLKNMKRDKNAGLVWLLSWHKMFYEKTVKDWHGLVVNTGEAEGDNVDFPPLESWIFPSDVDLASFGNSSPCRWSEFKVGITFFWDKLCVLRLYQIFIS